MASHNFSSSFTFLPFSSSLSFPFLPVPFLPFLPFPAISIIFPSLPSLFSRFPLLIEQWVGGGKRMLSVLRQLGSLSLSLLRFSSLVCYPHMPIGNVWIYRLLFVYFLFVCVYTVTDFSADDKASSVNFCTVVHRRLRQGFTNFCELCSPRSPKLDELAIMRTKL